jgi:DNA polymerase-1
VKHHLFEASSTGAYNIAILAKATSFLKQELVKNYLDPMVSMGQGSIHPSKVIAFTLAYNESNKAPAGFIKDYLANLLKALASLEVEYLYVADAAYFKVLTNTKKADPYFGYALPCKIEGFEHMTVVLGLNYQQLIYDPSLQNKLDSSIKALVDSINGVYITPGLGIIHSARYPQGVQEIAQALQSLHQYPRLTADIEAFSLDFDKAGIGTISFAWDKHNGLAFACDYKSVNLPNEPVTVGGFVPNPAVRALVRQFFETYQGEIIWHAGTGYDIKVVIYTLWMKDGLDTPGLLRGLEVMTRKVHDTKIITYLATNSTAGNTLGLKPNAQEFAGNWAVDEIKDIRRVPLPDLLQYNLVDALSTWFVFDKYMPVLWNDNQMEIYEKLMLPSAKVLIQTELTGMPISRKRVQEVKAKLEEIQRINSAIVMGSKAAQEAIKLIRAAAWDKDLADRKAKAVNPDKIKERELDAFDHLEFNPNSDLQVRRMLYEVMGLPIIDVTDSGLGSTGAETIKKLINHTTDIAHKEMLEALIIFTGVGTILSTFIPAFEQALDKGTGDVAWLHGSFNIGGTVSGRLSSSDPNLTNIPAKVKIKVGDVEIDLGKLVKYCFVSPPGWLFCGADFNSLEDMISALTTKDPNKLKVYTDGFDGHSVRAVGYWPEAFPDIDPNDPKQVNVLKKQDHPLRQESKVPTFALTYMGTYLTLVRNLGWEVTKAKGVEARYHELYKVSDKYVHDRLVQASKDGYTTVAFGLRVRTPLLGQVMFGKGAKIPSAAAAEGRTAGNAMGQSYCMLTMRAMADFMKKVWASKYRYDILPVALIHDADYLLIRNDAAVVEWANNHLIESMQWQELPEIQHDTVKLGANLGIFWPDWAHETTIPNGADRETIISICAKAKQELGESYQ